MTPQKAYTRQAVTALLVVQEAIVLRDGELVRLDDAAREALVDRRHNLHEVLVHARRLCAEG
jgi:hypothetical protein